MNKMSKRYEKPTNPGWRFIKSKVNDFKSVVEIFRGEDGKLYTGTIGDDICTDDMNVIWGPEVPDWDEGDDSCTDEMVDDMWGPDVPYWDDN